jgi:hypothetical protein
MEVERIIDEERFVRGAARSEYVRNTPNASRNNCEY